MHRVSSSSTPRMKYDYIVVGAGPAGVQMAYFLHQAKRNYLVLEAGDGPGTFFKTFPRHKTLISTNKRYNIFPEDDFNLRHDWNSLLSNDPKMRFTRFSDELFPSADSMVRYLDEFASNFKLNITRNTKVKNISKSVLESKDAFVITCEEGFTYWADVVLMACGAMMERIPDIPGKELATTYAKHSIKQDDYRNKKVCIVGAGNSAFEVANHLASHAGIIRVFHNRPIKLSWDTHFPGDLRAINNTVIDMFHLKSLHGLLEVQIKELERVDTKDGTFKVMAHFDMKLPHWNPPGTGHFKDIFDEIIFCTGWNYVQEDMFEPNCRPVVCKEGKMVILDDIWQSSVPNLFFIGTCMQQRDRQAASAFVHGFRYGVRSLFQILELTRHDISIPHRTFNPMGLQEIADFMKDRFSTTSALYQMNNGVLCDFVVFLTEENCSTPIAKYYYELPTEWAAQNMLKEFDDAWIIIFKDRKHSFPDSYRAESSFSKAPDQQVSNQPCTAFIQPIIRRYKRVTMEEEFALGVNLIVRPNMPQISGALNPGRFANLLKNLICKQLGRDSCYDDSLFSEENPVNNEIFTPWSENEVASHLEKMKNNEVVKSCDFDPHITKD